MSELLCREKIKSLRPTTRPQTRHSLYPSIQTVSSGRVEDTSAVDTNTAPPSPATVDSAPNHQIH
ncbi:hypothetical protein RR46_10416 [Papilio xuthus]|uniref:Uncharacterized protein n=1 Tax=Papilio xuthus TaxID=66420 RepID=A0A194Q199_PAPXU|nr:hypothetical protein RR46_10416 [Papilio xuthus]